MPPAASGWPQRLVLQLVAPAVGPGVWSDRGRVVAEKQHRLLGGCFARGAAAKVVCPRWDGGTLKAGVSPRLSSRLSFVLQRRLPPVGGPSGWGGRLR
jgi:hypothetical protein